MGGSYVRSSHGNDSNLRVSVLYGMDAGHSWSEDAPMNRETYFPPEVVQMFHAAERKRRWYHRVDWFKVLVWIGCAAYCGAFWYGVARAIDKGF